MSYPQNLEALFAEFVYKQVNRSIAGCANQYLGFFPDRMLNGLYERGCLSRSRGAVNESNIGCFHDFSEGKLLAFI
jgi:hypothetical protein